MCERLNICIIMSLTNVRHHRIMILLLIVTFYNVARAQYTTITNIRQTSLNPWRSELYVTASWSMNKHGDLLPKDINAAHHGSAMYMGMYELGLRYDLKKDKGPFFEASVGYLLGTLGYTLNPVEKPTVLSHWISLDANYSDTRLINGIIFVGVKSNVFIKSSNIRSGNFSILGIYDSCFNPATFFPYLGVRFDIGVFRLDGRIGYQVVEYLNPNKVALHTMTKSAVSPLYFEFGIGIKLFTNSNKTRSIEYIKS